MQQVKKTGCIFWKKIKEDEGMEGLEMICFQIISSVGTARSSYIEAIQKAKQGDFQEARECVAAGQKEFLKGHEAHFSLLQNQ